MDTQIAAAVMVVCRTKLINPNWKALGRLAVKRIEKHPSASTEEIADLVLRDYRLGEADE